MSSPSAVNEYTHSPIDQHAVDLDFPVVVRQSEHDVNDGVQRTKEKIDSELTQLLTELRSVNARGADSGIQSVKQSSTEALERNASIAGEIAGIFKDVRFRDADHSQPRALLQETAKVMAELDNAISRVVHDFSDDVDRQLRSGENTTLTLPDERLGDASHKAAEQLDRILNIGRGLQASVHGTPHAPLNHPLPHFQTPAERNIDEAPLKWVPGAERGWQMMDIAHGETITGRPIDRKEALKDLAVEEAKELVVDALIEKGVGHVLIASEVASKAVAEEIAQIAPDVARLSAEALHEANQASKPTSGNEKK